MVNNYYEVLGVAATAGADEIKKVYRRLARKYHPDVSREHNAEFKFKEIQEAYDTLKNPSKRSAYDLSCKRGPRQNYRQRRSTNKNQSRDGKYGDFFNTLFGERAAKTVQPGEDFHTKIDIPLQAILQGGKRAIVVHVPEINHHGDRQLTARTLTVHIPQGIRPGQKIRLKQQGASRSPEGPKGDLYLEVNLLPDKPYYLKGQDVYVDLPLAPWEAVLGCTVQAPTLAGAVDVKIAAGTQGGATLRLRGRGLPETSNQPATDVYIVVRILLPMPENKKDTAFYTKMSKLMPFNARENWP